MPHEFTLKDRIVIRAPIERCFALSTSITLVQRVLGMHAVRGRTAGFVTAGDTVLWKGWQLGLPQLHESHIDPFQRPTFFRDSMIAGRFHSFHHDHHFAQQPDHSTLLRDELHFSMPFGTAGAIAGRLLLVPHIRRLLHHRFNLLKRLAESDDWRHYLPAELPS